MWFTEAKKVCLGYFNQSCELSGQFMVRVWDNVTHPVYLLGFLSKGYSQSKLGRD